MTKNMGAGDRLIRTVIALAIAGLYVGGAIGGTLALVLGFFAIVFVATSLVGWCPGYLPLHFSTRKTPAALRESH